jgi:hypothetical protein
MENFTAAQALLTGFWPVWLSLLGFVAADCLGIGRD